ncbi:class E sortase [Streptomyces sparsogenes]
MTGPTGPTTGPMTRPLARPTAGPAARAAGRPAAGPVAGRAAPSGRGVAPASERPSDGPSRARHRRPSAPPAGPADPDATAVLPPVPAGPADPDATAILPPVPAAGGPAAGAPAGPVAGPVPGAGPAGGRRAARDDETVALRAVRAESARRPAPATPAGDDSTVLLRKVVADPAGTRTGTGRIGMDGLGTDGIGTDGIGTDRRRPTGSGPAGSEPGGGGAGGAADPQGPPPGGRAARRRAAQAAARRGGRRAARGGADGGTKGGTKDATAAGGASGTATAAPRTRMEAKRAARARKDSPAVIVSRVVGELFITVGVLMLLFVTYQLWWTNIRAHQQANGAANSLQKKWDRDGGKRDPGTFSPGEGFAILYIPKLDVKAPIAEGVSKQDVLDHGMVGHYGKGKLKTAMPWDKKGNFALAGHRNTHGEPFRYINHLEPGDKIVVETQNAFFTYEMTSILPQTSPSNTGVIGPVPPGSGFTKPGRYITLTTCTPEFTSKYRMIVWGKMVDERPRSEGKPDALVQ